MIGKHVQVQVCFHPGSDHMLSVVDNKHVGEIRALITSQGSWALLLAVNSCVNTEHLVFSVIKTGS